MPTLLMFAPCERVIVGEDDHNVSLIALLQNLNVQIPEGWEAPVDLAAPIKWSVVVLWRREDGDEDKEYQQRVQLVAPDERVVIDVPLNFRLPQSSQHNVVVNNGFPVDQPGICWLKLFLRDLAPAESESRLVATFPIEVTHLRLPTIDPARAIGSSSAQERGED
jgi:hypothetical protein